MRKEHNTKDIREVDRIYAILSTLNANPDTAAADIDQMFGPSITESTEGWLAKIAQILEESIPSITRASALDPKVRKLYGAEMAIFVGDGQTSETSPILVHVRHGKDYYHLRRIMILQHGLKNHDDL